MKGRSRIGKRKLYIRSNLLVELTATRCGSSCKEFMENKSLGGLIHYDG